MEPNSCTFAIISSRSASVNGDDFKLRRCDKASACTCARSVCNPWKNFCTVAGLFSASAMSLDASATAPPEIFFSRRRRRNVLLRTRLILLIFRLTCSSVAAFLLGPKSEHTPSAKAEITLPLPVIAEMKLRVPRDSQRLHSYHQCNWSWLLL